MNLSFAELLAKTRGDEWDPPKRLMSIDPGETCGWCVFNERALHKTGQIVITTHKDGRIVTSALWDLVYEWEPDMMVIEGYRVYASKASTHTWNALYTPKLIGALEAVCDYKQIPVVIQMASVKKFCSDDKLKAWGYYDKGAPHARDAVRHGCYYLLFHERRYKT